MSRKRLAVAIQAFKPLVSFSKRHYGRERAWVIAGRDVDRQRRVPQSQFLTVLHDHVFPGFQSFRNELSELKAHTDLNQTRGSIALAASKTFMVLRGFRIFCPIPSLK
jgi:hypothetical protein